MEYNRNAAVAYARKWALSRNPDYYNFEEIGGDCTNFISQCLYAGAGVMNYDRDNGWYYVSLFDRAPAWTGVAFLYEFLMDNKGAGPYAAIQPLYTAQIGDVIQLSFDGKTFEHSLMVVSTGFSPSARDILIACHTYDSLDRPLNSYDYRKARLLSIQGVNG